MRVLEEMSTTRTIIYFDDKGWIRRSGIIINKTSIILYTVNKYNNKEVLYKLRAPFCQK